MKVFAFIYSVLFLSNIALADDPNYIVIKGKTREYHTGLLPSSKEELSLKRTYMTLDGCDDLPDSFDLRPLGVVPEVRDQGNCGSCWAHPLPAAISIKISAILYFFHISLNSYRYL